MRLPDREVPIREVLAAGLGRLGGELIGVGESRKDAEPDHPLSGAPAFFEFNCTAIEAEVDRETGDITIVRHVIVSDVGKALNPLQVRMQDDGAAIQGLGHTLMEHYIYDDAGRVRNLGAIDYRIPTSMDLPQEMISEIIENGDGPGPYGAKGMSEGALLCVAAAVAGAVQDATRRRHPGPAPDAGASLARPADAEQQTGRRSCGNDAEPSGGRSRRERTRRGRAHQGHAGRAGRQGGRHDQAGAHDLAGRDALRRHAALPRPSALPGAQRRQSRAASGPASDSPGGPSTTSASATWPST